MKNIKKKKKSGFTLIELTLASAMISLLFIAIGITTSGIVNAYKKGLSIKSVNSLARDLIDDFSASANSAPAVNFETLCRTNFDPDVNPSTYQECVDDNAYHLIYQQWYMPVRIYKDATNYEEVNDAPIFGAFCTGKNSYVWNTGYTFSNELNSNYQIVKNDGSIASVPFLSGNYDSNDKHFRLVKFTDSDYNVCMSPFKKYLEGDPSAANAYSTVVNNMENFNGDTTDMYDLPTIGSELISYSKNPLALYDLVVFPPAQNYNTKRLFYSSSMIVATISGGVNIMSSGDFCAPPSDLELQSDFSYCAINKFNFTMRATGE